MAQKKIVDVFEFETKELKSRPEVEGSYAKVLIDITNGIARRSPLTQDGKQVLPEMEEEFVVRVTNRSREKVLLLYSWHNLYNKAFFVESNDKDQPIIASKLRDFHNLDMPGPKSFLLWDRLRNWLRTAKSVCPSDEFKEFHLDSLEKEITSLESEFSGEEQCLGFCHNDLQYGNIMIDEETRALTIIDYEYASFNPVAYDITNLEMAADSTIQMSLMYWTTQNTQMSMNGRGLCRPTWALQEARNPTKKRSRI